jgi:hypothetical protein
MRASRRPKHSRVPPASLFTPARRFFSIFDAKASPMPEMAQRSESPPSSSMRHSSAAVDDEDTERDPHIPGSIPPWVHISSSEDDTLIPPPVRPNTRHYKPPPSHYKAGRKWDHERSAEPPLMSAPIADHQTRWLPFMQSGPHPPWNGQGARLMSPEWMEDNVPITVQGWEEEDEALADKQEDLKGFWLLSPAKRERTVRLFWVSSIPLSFAISRTSIFYTLDTSASLQAYSASLAAVLNAGFAAERPCSRVQRWRACVEVEPLGGQVS